MTTTATPPPDDPAWTDVRARYEGSAETVHDIAASIGMTRFALSLRALKLGWKLRGAVNAKTRRKNMRKDGRKDGRKAGIKDVPPSTRDTIIRLKDMLQKRVTQLEQELKELGTEVDALSNERGIKSVGVLVRTLEKVLDLERKDKLKRKQATREHKYFDDEQRRQLAEKIERLEADRDSGLAGPQPGEGGSGRVEQPVALLGEAGPAIAAGEG